MESQLPLLWHFHLVGGGWRRVWARDLEGAKQKFARKYPGVKYDGADWSDGYYGD